MMSLVNKITSFVSTKLLWGAILVLVTLLTVSHISNQNKAEQINDLTLIADRAVTQNTRLSDQLNELRVEIETRPTKLIETTKEVMVEICKGKVTIADINALPSKREVKNETEAPVADIDDRLPDELIQLLK